MSPIEWKREDGGASVASKITFTLSDGVEVTVEVPRLPFSSGRTLQDAEAGLMAAAVDALKFIAKDRPEILLEKATISQDGIPIWP